MTWSLITIRSYLINEYQLSGEVSRGMQSRQILNGEKSAPLDHLKNNLVSKTLDLALAGF